MYVVGAHVDRHIRGCFHTGQLHRYHAGPLSPQALGPLSPPLFVLCQDLLCQQWAWASPHAAINVIDILSISRKKIRVLKIYSTPHKILSYFFFMVGSKIGKINSLKPITLSAECVLEAEGAELGPRAPCVEECGSSLATGPFSPTLD
jgi:hypothetical protein